MSIVDKLKGMLGKSPDKAKQGLDKASSFVDEKTGGKYGEKIDQASEKAREYIDRSSGEGGQEGQGDQQNEGGPDKR